MQTARKEVQLLMKVYELSSSVFRVIAMHSKYKLVLSIILHLHLVIWQTLLSKATYNWGIHKAIQGNQTEEVLVTPSLSHCSNKYKLAREGEKDKGKVFFFFFFFF